MSHATLFRLSALAGLSSALLLVVNAARVAEVLPDGSPLRAIAPLASLAGMFLLTGLYLWQQQRAGALGLLGYVLNAAGIAGVFAIEYTVHFTFANLDDDIVDELVDNATGVAFTVTSVIFIIGVVVFSSAIWRTHASPREATILYAAGLTVVGLRNLVPEPIYIAGLIVAAAGIGWLSMALYRGATSDARPTYVTS
jgi:hypothetical protein